MSILLCMESMAQVERVLPRKTKATLEGTEFLLAFMENEVRVSEAPVVLRIFIASEFMAKVTVDYADGTSGRYTIQPDDVQVVDVPAQWMSTMSETTDRKSIRVTSDVPIVVYALNSRVKSTDTYTAIPVKHFGTDYMVVSRGVDRYRIDRSRPNPTLDTTSRQGEFLIVANEDNTRVTYITTARTERGLFPGIPYSVTLNAGQTFLVKGAKGPSGSHDLTGSRVSADKPIGVFSGHMRASVPRSDAYNKDHLCEMLLPTDKWGFEHITTPFQNTKVGDMIRIVAQHDGTVVTAETGTMQSRYDIPKSGGWIEFPSINFPVRWTSNRPVMVAQTMMSNQTEMGAIMDPAMVIVPPVERYVERAVFRIPELLPQADASFDSYAYYFSVIAEDSAVTSITANGIPLVNFDPGFRTRYVPGTRMCYASFRVDPATFVLESSRGKFSGVMYGVGPADSYANIYGMSLDSVVQPELTPPSYALRVDCGDVEGVVRDSGQTGGAKTVYLRDVTVVASRTYNYDYTLTRSVDTLGTTQVSARVKDRLRDARLVIHAWDSLGNGKEWDYFYDAPSVEVRASVIDTRVVPACTTVVVHNRDSTPVNVSAVRLTGDARYRLSAATRNTVIRPRDSLRVEVCLDPPYFPPAPPATIHVDMPCDFSVQAPVRPLTGTSMATVDLDVGDVRVGDTACGYAYIVNDGIDPITVDALVFQRDTVFVADTAGLALPRILLPGDSLRVRVCFMPMVSERSLRADTVRASPMLTGVVRYRGRGIRPEVSDIVIDWGQRRVGTRHDSVAILRNTGNASCVARPVVQTATSFDIYQALGRASAMAPSAADTVPVAFTPQNRGRVSHTMAYLVDWRFHDTVRVLLRGIGTQPGLTTYDIDMGAIRIATVKDSLATMGIADGDEQLTIDTMWLQGPDAASFALASDILTTRLLNVDEILQGLVTFAPNRVGLHRAQLVITHDAAPAFERRTSIVNLVGVGLPLDTAGIELALDVADTMPACVLRTATCTLRNSGNIPCMIDDIVVLLDGRPLDVPALTQPVFLQPSETTTFTIDLETGAAGERLLTITARACDSLLLRSERRILVTPHAIRLQTTTDVQTSPGATITLHGSLDVAGPELPVTPSIALVVASDRVALTQRRITAIDSATATSVTFDVTQDRDRIRMVPRQQIVPPYRLQWDLDVTALWKDPLPFDVVTQVQATPCTDEIVATSRVYVENCADAYRMVRLGMPTIVSADIRPMPAREHIAVVLETTAELTVSMDLVDLSGAVIARWEKIDLKKGLTHCNFNCSMIADGTYRLRVGQGTQQLSLPLVIVN